MKLLGIIGGMSTASSISYYQKINEQINQRLGANHGARLPNPSRLAATDNMRPN